MNTLIDFLALNNDWIKQEALLENDLSVPSVILSDLSLCKETNGEGDETKDGSKDSSQVSCETNKASDTGLGSPSKSVSISIQVSIAKLCTFILFSG